MFTLQSRYLFFFSSLEDVLYFWLSIATVFCWKWQNIRDHKALGIWVFLIFQFKMEKTSADWIERVKRNASVPVSFSCRALFQLPHTYFACSASVLNLLICTVFQEKTRHVLLLISLIWQGCFLRYQCRYEAIADDWLFSIIPYNFATLWCVGR